MIRQTFLIVGVLCGILTLNSCTKNSYVESEQVIETVTNKNLTVENQEGRVFLGYDNETKKPIIGNYTVKLRHDGQDNIDDVHVIYRASSDDGNYVVQFFASLVFNPNTGETEPVIVGDIISIGFDDGECYWCECMDSFASMDTTGGLMWGAYGAVCPECLLVAVVGISAYCAGSALSQLTDG
jgi:hypothetical protein